MALTLNNFIGFETGGLEEASETAGTPVTVTLIVRTGSYALELSGAADDYKVSPFESVSDAGDKQILGFAAYFTDASPATAQIFLNAIEDNNEGSTFSCFQLTNQTNGDLRITWNDGTTNDIGTPFTDNTWHYIEIVWQHLASGTFDIVIDDGTPSSFTGKDLVGAGTNFDRYWFHAEQAQDWYVDDFYCMSGATGTSDFLGTGTEVLGAFQNTAEDATDQGGTLIAGGWDDISNTPNTGSEASYEQNGAIEGFTICDEGILAGPSGQAAGTIAGAKFLHRLKRTNGSSPTTLDQSYGNSGDGVTATDRAAALTTAYQNFFIVSEAASIVPTNSENFAQGMGQTGNGGRDIFAEDIWSFLLHVPSATLSTTLADMNFPGGNYYVGPFGT